MTIYLLYLLLGSVAGVMAGLLGIGGGVIVVPGLLALFALQDFPDEWMMHTAIATSLATVMVTSFSAALVHYRLKAIQWALFPPIAIGMIVGGVLGPFVASHSSSVFLQICAGIILLLLACYMLLPHLAILERPLPPPWGLGSRSTFVGCFSSMLGIGSGIILVPMLHRYRIPLRESVATASACMFMLALTGTITYAIAGFTTASLPPATLGFIFLPAFFGIAIASSIFAPVGARLVHRLPVALLKRLFGGVLLVVAVWMLLM